MATEPARPFSRRNAFIALLLALIAASAMLDYHLGYFLPRVLEIRAAKGLGQGYSFGGDFYPIWLTARDWQVNHSDLYSPAITRKIQTGLFGRPLDAGNPQDPPGDYRSFAYPAYTVLLFEPTAALEFPTLRLVLILLLPLLTIASLGLWMRALEWRIAGLWFTVIALLTLCSYPLLEAFFAEQPGLVAGFCLAAAALALRQNRLPQSGIFLALTLIKPQMTALAAIYLLLWSLSDWRAHWKFAVSFLATITLMLATSLLLWPHWIGLWLHIVLDYHTYATPALVTELFGPGLGSHLGPFIIILLITAGLALAFRHRNANENSYSFWLTLSLMLAITSVTLLPGQAIYDHVILLPGIFLTIQHWKELQDLGRVPRILLQVSAAVLFWPWAAAIVLVGARQFLSVEQFYSTAIFALPIRTAGSFPFAVLVLLGFGFRLTGIANSKYFEQPAL
jgi:Glycosyltransferase family 87